MAIRRLVSLVFRPDGSARRACDPSMADMHPPIGAVAAPSCPGHRPPGRRMQRLAHLAGLAALLSLVAGCSALPEPRAGPPPSGTAAAPAANAHPEVDATRGEFTTPASMLDTWNAVGQILVRLEGVGYESRAQMLGIYAVGYRGERLLIVTRALVMRSQAQGMSTKVGAALLDGKPSGSAAAVELLGQLQRRLPAELARIKAGGGPSGRQPVRCAGDAAHAGLYRLASQCPGGAPGPPRIAAAHAPTAAAAPASTRLPVFHPR